MRQVSDDPVVRAAGYVYAAIGSLNLARHLLPDDHPIADDLAKLIRRAQTAHDNLTEPTSVGERDQ